VVAYDQRVDAETEFRVPTSEGALVGWLRESPSAGGQALLLHGGPGLSEYLDSLSDELDGLLTTARYQQRGLEPSELNGRVDVEGSVEDALAVMDALGWERPIVVGHSWGGHLALHVAAAHPDRVGALVILDSLGATGDGGVAVFAARLRDGLSDGALERLDQLEAIEESTQAEHDEHLRILWPNYFGDPATAPEMPAVRFSERADETWQSIIAHLADGTLERRLPAVDAPALVIHGSRSPIPLDQAESVAALMPNGRLVVHEGKGHWAWLEEPGFVRRQVERLLVEA